MKRNIWLAFALSAVLGAAWHFFYDWVPLPLVALAAPVNESVWEHLKLLYFPVLLVGAGLSLRWRGSRQLLWSGLLTALLAMPLGLCAAYYLLLGALGVQGLAVDLTLYALSMAGGAALCWQLVRSGRALGQLGLLVMAVGIYGAALVVFTLAAPPLPIFAPPVR